MALMASSGDAEVIAAMSGGRQRCASGYRGVTQQRDGRFVVAFFHHHKRHSAGCSFTTAAEAAAALERLRATIIGRAAPRVARYHEGVRLCLSASGSGYRGVTQCTRPSLLQRGFSKSDRAVVTVNGAQRTLGYYASAIDAAVAYATFFGR